MKHLRNLTIGLLLTVITMTQLVHAQTGDVSGSGGAIYCRNGGRDYGNFLSAVIAYDGFYEYWKDILVRYNANQCLYNDIDYLLQRINKTRDQIRNAFYVCDGSAPKLAKTYYELEAELYYLRKYVDVDKGNILINEKGASKDFIDYVVNNRNFYNTRAEAQVVLDKFIAKYQARQDTYINCSDPTWGNLIAKWNEFKSNLGGFTAVQEAAESINKRWDSLVNTPFKRTGGLLGGLLDTKINGLDPATAWYDISSELSRNIPSTANSVTAKQATSASQQATYGFTFDQFQNAASSDSEWHDAILIRTGYLAQYEQLYQQGTASLTKEIINRVTYLEGTIKATYPFIDQTTTCTKGIIDRTCK